MRMLCRNLVKDYDVWKPIFDENLASAKDAGFTLENLWRNIEEPNEVFFIFEIEDMESAKGFISDPESAKEGERSGVLEGNCWFVE